MLKLEMHIREEELKKVGGDEQLLDELSKKLRLWLEQQLHLPQDISDRRLKYLVYAAKFDFEKAKKRLDLYCSIRNWIPEIFADFDPLSDSVEQFHKYVQYVSIPKLTPEKYRLTLCSYVDSDPSLFDFWQCAKYGFMLYEMRIKEDMTDNSDIVVWDLKKLCMGHVVKITPGMMKKIDNALEAYGMKIKGIYIINAPSYTDIIMKMLKAVMKTKLVKRIHVFTSGVESLYEIIPRSLFPSDYGGDQPSTDTLTKMWNTSLAERRNWFLQQDNLKTDESRRSKASILNPDDLFGISGTFRKLDID